MGNLQKALLWALLPLAVAACDYMALSFDGSMGLVVITVSDDDYRSPHGYRIRARQAGTPDRIVLIPAGGNLEIEATGPESIELTLFEPPDCRVIGRNPLLVTPTPGQPVRAGFTVECAAAPRLAAP